LVLSQKMEDKGSFRMAKIRLIPDVPASRAQKPDKYEITFQGDGLASGLYFCRLQVGDFSLPKLRMSIRQDENIPHEPVRKPEIQQKKAAAHRSAKLVWLNT